MEGQNTFLEGHDFCFYYIFKRKFSGNKKIWGDAAPECNPWLRAWSRLNQARNSVSLHCSEEESGGFLVFVLNRSNRLAKRKSPSKATFPQPPFSVYYRRTQHNQTSSMMQQKVTSVEVFESKIFLYYCFLVRPCFPKTALPLAFSLRAKIIQKEMNVYILTDRIY